MKTVYIAYLVIMSYSFHCDEFNKYDTVSEKYPNFHITMFSDRQYTKGDVVPAGFEMLIPDSLMK